MTVYAVFLNEPDEDAWAAVREGWPRGRNFILTDNLAFVAPEEGIVTTTGEIAEKVGIRGEQERLGIVFEWNTHTGFNRSDLWEWFRQVRP